MIPNFLIKQQQARLAQSVARETLNLKVVGSSPTSGCVFLQKKSCQSDWWWWRYCKLKFLLGGRVKGASVRLAQR